MRGPSHSNGGKRKSTGYYARRCIAELLEPRAYLSGYTLNSVESFVPPPNGAFPESCVTIDSSGDVFGTASQGGANNDGTVFEIAHGSTSITTLASFNSANGASPEGSVALDSSGNLFGATEYGGPSNDGTVFEIAHGTTSITMLASFYNNQTIGEYPYAGVTIDSSGNLFGSTSQGGMNSDGTVFEIAHGTTAITTLASFNNTNGANPESGLTLDSSGSLLGTTCQGGANSDGTVFKIAHGTTSITTLASFNDANGAWPAASVTLDSSGNLFGTASNGGANSDGTVFEIAHGTTSITAVASFNGTNGEYPSAGVVLDSSGNLFGTAPEAGANGDGTVFEIAHGTTSITAVASFNGTNGSWPAGGVTLDSSGDLWGTAPDGGTNNYGTVFEIAHGSSSISTVASFNGTSGWEPQSSVTPDSSGDLFGTTSLGGTYGLGTVFEIAHGTTAITTLASFNNTNGAWPEASVTLDSSGDLFGTTSGGGANNVGTVFENAHGTTSVTTLGNFSFASDNSPSAFVSLDSSGNIFGTTEADGANGDGTVFEIAHGTTSMTTLASFNDATGESPSAGVTLDSSGDLFGTTESGGAYYSDQVYYYIYDGTVFEIAHGTTSISVVAGFATSSVNTTGGCPIAAVTIDSSGDLFGTTSQGGASGYGTVFEVPHGKTYVTTVASFNNSNGGNGGVAVDSSGNLLGTTTSGGTNNDGMVFEITHGTTSITAVANFNGISGESPAGGLTPDSSGNFFGTTSAGGTGNAGLVFELSPLTTATAVTSNNNSAVYGQAVTFTATVTPNIGSGETGTVQFQIDGSNVGSPVILSGNTATYTTWTLNAGSHSVVAVYSGDSNFATSTSPAIAQNVAKFVRAIQTLAAFDFDVTIYNESPEAAVVLDSSGNLFGTTETGGANDSGTIFEIAHGGYVITTLASFNWYNGYWPSSVVLDSSGNIFGTAEEGGANLDGTVFEIAHGSGVITALASFNGANGAWPAAGVALDSSGNLFGAAGQGGANSDGTVFEIAHGSGVITILASFNGANGQRPSGVVLDSSGNLFGTTEEGGANGEGTVFEIANGNLVVTTLAPFNGTSGEYPQAGVVLDSSGNLFGTTPFGGNFTVDNELGSGTVFEVAHGSAAITALAAFNGINGACAYDGVDLDSTGNLFGTTYGGGPGGYGTVFEIARGSAVITTQALFNLANGAFPNAGSVLDSSGDLFGATWAGGADGYGTVFELGPGYTVTSNNASPVYGQPVTFTATVPNVGVGPTGTVQFRIDSSNVGSPVALSGNSACYTTSALSAGTHSIVAVYSGDANFAGMTSPAFTQNVRQSVMHILSASSHIMLDPSGQNMDVWNSIATNGTPDQCVACSNICGVNYTGPDGGDTFVLDYSNGDPLPAGGIALTGGAGQNTLEILGDPGSPSDILAINGGTFTIPANAPAAGPLDYTVGTLSVATGAELALAQSVSQSAQTILNVNNLSVSGVLQLNGGTTAIVGDAMTGTGSVIVGNSTTAALLQLAQGSPGTTSTLGSLTINTGGALDLTNNTLLINETNVSLPAITTWVQSKVVTSSLVAGPHAIASRAVGYGDHSADPITIPAGDVEVKYVPTGDTNLDAYVDITDVTRAINNLGQSPGYYGGDVLNQGIVNITDIAAIINDLGGNLTSSGDSTGVASVAVRSSAGAVIPAALAHAAVTPPSGGGLVGSLFSDTRIAGDWLESPGSVLEGE